MTIVNRQLLPHRIYNQGSTRLFTMSINKASASSRPHRRPSRSNTCLAIVVIVLLLTATIFYNFETWHYLIPGHEQHGASIGSEEEEENNRCVDLDDLVAWKELPQKQQCLCPDPTIASKDLRQNQPEWMEHFHTMMNDVVYELSQPQPSLDIVFLGDSIMERWNGTRSMGTRQNFPEFRDSFDSMFNKRQNGSHAKLQGLLLGTSGDITTELLWRISQNDVHPTQPLQPKVFMILIGTNDLGRMECSKNTTLQGIVNVIKFVSSALPTTPLIIHGLLPRSDIYNQGDYNLGRYWQDIMYINRELERICRECPKQLWHFMDASHIFLTNKTSAGDDTTGSSGPTMMINQTLMSDSLHPDVLGYNIWGQEIVQKVLQIIN